MPQLDNSLPPGLAGFMATRSLNQQADQSNLSNITGITGILAKLQAAQQEQELRDALASGDFKRLAGIPGGLEILSKMATMKNAEITGRLNEARITESGTTGQLNTARLADLKNKSVVSGQEQQAKSALANLLASSGSFGQGTDAERPNAQVFTNDAEAIAAMRAAEAAGRPFTGNVPNPGNVRALTLAAGNAIPRGASAELLKQLGPQKSTEITPYQSEMLRLRQAQLDKPTAAPQPRNLQLTTDSSGNQLIVNPDGTTRPLTTEDGAGVRKPIAADRPMTEFQGKAALYGTRAAQSDKVLKSIEDKISTTGLAAGQATGVLGNFLMSSDQRRVDQAQRDFVNAVLRQESGAVISDAEFANAKRQYFPQPGDDPKVISQKRANRQLAIQGFARMSGPKGGVDIQAVTDAPLLPGVPAISPTPPQAGRSTSGYVEMRRTSDGRVLGKKADGTVEEIK